MTDNREDMITTIETTFDSAKAEAFGGHMMSILTGSLLSSMVDIGHRTGLFTAAAEGPATSEQLAADQDRLGGYGRGELVGSFDELAALEAGSGTDKRDEVGSVLRARRAPRDSGLRRRVKLLQ